MNLTVYRAYFVLILIKSKIFFKFILTFGQSTIQKNKALLRSALCYILYATIFILNNFQKTTEYFQFLYRN